MANNTETITKEITALLPLTVAEYQNEAGNWVIEGLEYPFELESTSRAAGEHAVRMHILYHWDAVQRLMRNIAIIESGDDEIEFEGEDGSWDTAL